MTLFGMDGGAAIAGFAAMAILALAVLLFGGLGVGASGQGDWSRAFLMSILFAVAATMSLAGQAHWSRRRDANFRAVHAGLAGGPPVVVALVALIVAFAHLTAGEPAAASYGVAISAAGALAALAAWQIFQRTQIRILPPFNPLQPTTFAADPDPPAYPALRELRIAPRKPRLLRRLRRLIWRG